MGTGTKWKTGIFGCFHNCSVCIIGMYLPCVLYGQNAQHLNGTQCFSETSSENRHNHTCIMHGLLYCCIKEVVPVASFFGVLFGAQGSWAHVGYTICGYAFASGLAGYGVACLGSGMMNYCQRTAIRKMYGIQGTAVDDLNKSLCCTACALIQHTNHINAMKRPTTSVMQRY